MKDRETKMKIRDEMMKLDQKWIGDEVVGNKTIEVKLNYGTRCRDWELEYKFSLRGRREHLKEK